MRILSLAILAILSALPLRAETGTPAAPPAVVEVDPMDAVPADLLALARDGNLDAAYEVAGHLVTQGTEAAQRAALPFLRQTYDGYAEAADDNGRAMRGIAALELSKTLRALQQYTESLTLSQEAQDILLATDLGTWSETAAASAMENHAVTLQALSRYEESILYLQTARTWHEGQSPPDRLAIASLWNNEGVGWEGMKQFGPALDAYYAAAQIYGEDKGWDSLDLGYLANNIAWVQTQQGELEDARGWQEMALKIIAAYEGDYARNTAIAHTNLAMIAVREGKPDEAITRGMEAMAYISGNKDQSLDLQRWTFELLSQAYAAKDQPDRAIFFGKLAVNAQQAIRAANSGTRNAMAASQTEWRRLYRDLAQLLVDQGRFSEAQAVLNMEKEEEVFEFLKRDASADLSQTRALLNRIEAAQAETLDALPSPVAAERQLRIILAAIDAGTATPEDEDRALALQDALQRASDDFEAQVASFLAEAPQESRAVAEAQFDAVGSYQAILETLPRPTAILQVAALDDRVHLFLTLPGLTLHEEAEARDLNARIFATLQAIEAVSPDARAHLADLYDTLFAPVDDALAEAGIEVVMLNLDGALRYVPFAALHDGQGYLVERYAFALYSPTVPTQFGANPRQPDKTAGFGVTAAHPGFSALPGVRTELATIFDPAAGALDGPTVLDADFTESALKRSLLKRPEVLHIASHFALQPGQEDASFLLLGDGSHLPLSKLRATKALSFRGVDLLTLSACQTARGGDGSEVEGFGATAQLNGAGAVMASLWPVSDAATPRLMHDFYAGMMEQGLDKAEALRRAQVAMLTGRGAMDGADRTADALAPSAPVAAPGLEHPNAWAAFVLMGNWL
jgi:CHAT domain-containing protein